MIAPREMTARDRRFVVPTWGASSRYQGLRKRKRYAIADRLLDRGARVVCLASDDLTVHAWACGEGDVLHYVYVALELRRHGFAKRAITALFGSYPEHINVTHEWPGGSSRFRYTPHLLFQEAA